MTNPVYAELLKSKSIEWLSEHGLRFAYSARWLGSAPLSASSYEDLDRLTLHREAAEAIAQELLNRAHALTQKANDGR